MLSVNERSKLFDDLTFEKIEEPRFCKLIIDFFKIKYGELTIKIEDVNLYVKVTHGKQVKISKNNN